MIADCCSLFAALSLFVVRCCLRVGGCVCCVSVFSFIDYCFLFAGVLVFAVV